MPQSKGLGTANSGSSGGSGAATNSIVIDMSGIGGLAPNFYGDSDQTSTLPQRRIPTDETQMVEGFFNPWMRQGYLSPSVSTLNTITVENTPDNVFSSTEYDAPNQTIYFGESGRRIHQCTSLDGTNFTLAKLMDSGIIIDDLQIYELGGVRALLYSFQLNAVIVTPDHTGSIFTSSSGRFAAGTPVTFSTTGSLPTGISAGTVYYIGAYGDKSIGSNFNIYPTQALAIVGGVGNITFSNNGSGNLTMNSVSGFGGIGAALLPFGSSQDYWLNGAAFNTGSVTSLLNLSNAAHFMRLGYDGYMYIFDGNTVHRLDGSILGGIAGTITKQVYSVLPYEIMTDAICYRQQMFIAVQENSLSNSLINSTVNNYISPCHITIWDMTNTAGQVKDIISIVGIKTIKKLYISPSGHLRLICVTANSLTQIREYNGSEFLVIKQLGLGAYPQYPDSLIVANNLTMWIANDGTLYGHGNVLENSTEVLAKIGSIIAPETTNYQEINLSYAGAIAYGSGNLYSATGGYRIDRQGLTIGWSNGTSSLSRIFPFDVVPINGVSQQPLQGNIYTGVHFLESSVASYYTGTRFLSQLSTVGFINIFMASSGTDTQDTTLAATIRIFFNGSTTQWGSGKTITFHDISVGYKRIEVNQPYVNTIQLKIEYATGNNLSDSSDFHPYTAMVYYSPTNTRG